MYTNPHIGFSQTCARLTTKKNGILKVKQKKRNKFTMLNKIRLNVINIQVNEH